MSNIACVYWKQEIKGMKVLPSLALQWNKQLKYELI